MESLMFLDCFVTKLSKKNLWGVGLTPLVKEGLSLQNLWRGGGGGGFIQKRLMYPSYTLSHYKPFFES